MPGRKSRDLCGRVGPGGRGDLGRNWKGAPENGVCRGGREGEIKKMLSEPQPREPFFFLLWKGLLPETLISFPFSFQTSGGITQSSLAFVTPT